MSRYDDLHQRAWRRASMLFIDGRKPALVANAKGCVAPVNGTPQRDKLLRPLQIF